MNKIEIQLDLILKENDKKVLVTVKGDSVIVEGECLPRQFRLINRLSEMIHQYIKDNKN